MENVEETFNVALGKKLRSRRLTLGLTQTDVANKKLLSIAYDFMNKLIKAQARYFCSRWEKAVVCHSRYSVNL